MTESDGQPGTPSSSAGVGQTRPAIQLALCAALAGQLLALAVALTDSAPPNLTLATALGCSIIAIAAMAELRPWAASMRRKVTALMGAQVAAAALTLAGVAPRVPWPIPLAGLIVAAGLGAAGLVVARYTSAASRAPLPLTLAPRVAAIALCARELVQYWATSATGLSRPLLTAVFLVIAALGVALLASFSIIAMRVQPRWAIAGLLAWTVGWVSITADLASLIVWSLGGPFPMGSHQLRPLDADLVQLLATFGGVALGAALAGSISDLRFRHSAMILLAGCAAFGVIAAVAEHRIELASDFPSITVLRKNRDLADVISATALAGMLWLYWRRVVVPGLSRAAIWDSRD